MAYRVCYEKSGATFRRAMPMKTRLRPMSWLEAIDILPDERHSNIEYKSELRYNSPISYSYEEIYS